MRIPKVVGTLTAASVEQQRSAAPLVPPHDPPATAAVLDMPYADFKHKALGAIDLRCVLEPLRGTAAGLLSDAPPPPPPPPAAEEGVMMLVHPAAAAGACVGLLCLGLVCGLWLKSVCRRCRALPRPKRLIELTSLGTLVATPSTPVAAATPQQRGGSSPGSGMPPA